MTHDLLLKGGTLIDPSQRIHAKKDIAFENGKVAKICDSIDEKPKGDMIDCTGKIVAPGLIDLHVHGFWGVSHYGVEPDPYFISKGVTTVLDVGSAGADTFPGFRKYVIERCDTRLFALLHISSQGMLCREIGELIYPEYADVDKAVAMIEENRDVLLGVKVRLTNRLVGESLGIEALKLARKAADATGLPLMVHPQDAWCDSLDDILSVLKTGDVLTHCFHGHGCGILDEQGGIRKTVYAARDRGVVFDVGHGIGSFNWQVAEKACEHDFFPDTVSSDLHVYGIDGPVFDLVTTMSKFLYLGLSLEDVLEKTTAAPAKILRIPDRIGTLAQGAEADAVVLDIQTGSFDYWDAHEQKRTGHRKIVVEKVISKGKIYN